MGRKQMDPDRYQMRDLKRRIAFLEKAIGYKLDERIHSLARVLRQELGVFQAELLNALVDEVGIPVRQVSDNYPVERPRDADIHAEKRPTDKQDNPPFLKKHQWDQTHPDRGP